MQDIFLFLQNHWQLTTAVIIVMVLLMLLELLKAKQSTANINPAQAVDLINHKNAVVLDIRNTDAFKSGHVLGAVSLP